MNIRKGCWHFWRVSHWLDGLCWKCHDKKIDGK